MRAASLLAACLLAACTVDGPRAEPTAEEQRLLAYLARDPRVVIEHLERDGDNRLLVVTTQGRIQRRYLIAPDDPALPALRLRPLLDESRLEVQPNPRPGGGPVTRGHGG